MAFHEHQRTAIRAQFIALGMALTAKGSKNLKYTKEVYRACEWSQVWLKRLHLTKERTALFNTRIHESVWRASLKIKPQNDGFKNQHEHSYSLAFLTN